MRVVTLILIIAWLPRCAEREETPPPPRGRMQLLLGVADQQRGDVRVTLKNLINRPLVVCREEWTMPRGLIRLHIFRTDGQELPLSSTALRGLAEVTEEKHLIELPPFGTISGVMNLRLREQYGVAAGEYDVEVEYFCPFEGPRIERVPHRSNRVHIMVR